jgi:nucleolar protein 58
MSPQCTSPRISVDSSFRLKTFEKFENTADALDNAAAIVEGKVAPKLSNLLKSLDEKAGSLIVSDPKLGKMSCTNADDRNFDKSDS